MNLGTWTPRTEHVAINGGHLCMGANCWPDSPNDGGASLGVTGSVLAACDVHHAQRNIRVVATKRLTGDAVIAMQAPEEGEGIEAELTVALARGRTMTNREWGLIVHDPVIREELGEGIRDFHPRRSRLRPALLQLTGGDSGEPGERTRLSLRPGERRDIKFNAELNQRSRPGETHAVDVVTRDHNGDVIGGARMLVVAL